MSETIRACYRDRDNGVYFVRQGHRHDCDDSECRGCTPCAEHHCMARKNCAWHIGAGELTCGRCLGAVRRDLRWIGDLSPLMMTAAIAAGVNSEAASLAGPSVDPEAWSWRKAAARRGVSWHLSLVEEDDEHHPLRVTQAWVRMISEDYDHDIVATTVADAVAYLDRQLHRIANDDSQDFLLLSRELRKCRQHLEAVLHNDDRPDRGAPCPECTSEESGVGPRLTRQYGHWCDSPDCERVHHADDSADMWVCPRNEKHAWESEAYDRWITERRATTA